VAADAHAEIFFPKLFSVDELPYTGFVFLNPDPTLATVNFYLISASGSTVASGVLTVGAGGQVSKLGSDLFPHPGAGGWVYILNDTEGMQAFWLNYDAGLTYVAGSEAAQYDTIGSDQIIPLVAADAELNIINPNFSKVSLTIRLFGTDREVASAFTAELQIAGAFQSKVSVMFPSADMTQAQYVRIRSGGLPIASTILIHGFLVQAGAVVLNGENSGSRTELIFPQAVTGALGVASYTTVLGVTNAGTVPQTLAITFNPDAGDPMTVKRTLPANGALRATAQDLFGLPPDFQTGWIKVSGTAPITGFLAYADTVAGGVVAVPSRLSQTKQFFSYIAEGPPQWQTGLAILNIGDTSAAVEMFAVDPDGKLIGNASFTVDAGKKLANVIHEWIPQTRGINGGFVFLRTSNNVRLYGTELFYTEDLKVLSSIAAAKLNPGVSYSPPSP